MLVDPQVQTVSTATVSVDIKISGAGSGPVPGSLAGYSFTLSWDQTILTLVSVNNGPFLGSTGRTVTCPAPTSTPGSVTFGCETSGAQPGPNGSGILATVQFGVLGPGTTPVTLSGVTVTDTSGASFAMTTNDGTITVQ